MVRTAGYAVESALAHRNKLFVPVDGDESASIESPPEHAPAQGSAGRTVSRMFIGQWGCGCSPAARAIVGLLPEDPPRHMREAGCHRWQTTSAKPCHSA